MPAESSRQLAASHPDARPGPAARPALSADQWSVRSSLFWLALACLLPGVIGAAVLILHEYRAGRAQLERDTIQTARALVQAVDNRILRAQTLAEGLVTADSLARGDLAAFHRRARAALAQSGQGQAIVLADRAGRQILNTEQEFGTLLPPHGSPELVGRVFATGEPVISDLFTSKVLQRPVIGVAVPVVLDGRVAHALTVIVRADDLERLLSAQRLPRGWVATILDGTDTIVARSRDSERFVGQKPADAFLRRFGETEEGSFEAVMKDGVPVVSSFSRSPVTGWRVAISIPLEALADQLNRRLATLAWVVSGLFAVGLGLAWLVGGKIARSFQALIAPAFALGSGKPVRLPAVGIVEAAEVLQALGEAAELLKKRDAALQESESRLRELIAALPGMVWSTTAEGAVDFVSQQWTDYTGTTFDSQLGAGFLAAIHPDDREHVAGIWKAAVASGTTYSAEYRLRSRDGAYRWFSARGAPVCRQEGQVARWLGVVTDIDARKRAEDSLRQERSRLQAIIDNSPLLILVKDMASRVVLANKAIFENIRVPPRERFVGRSLFELFPPDIAEARWMKDLATLERNAPLRSEENIKHLDGTWHTYVTVRFPVHDIETQELIGVCAIATDISEQKAVEAEIQRLNAELEQRVEERTVELERSNEALLQSNTELKHFAHATAHDLKTPLRAIAGFAQLLQREVRSEGGDRLLELSARVIENTKRLQALIDDLLAYTRLDALGLPFEPVDLQAVVEEVLANLSALIRETGAEVRHGEMPRVAADRSQLALVIQNLIENGIKYNHSKPPKISVGCERQADKWVCSVKDNGIGVEPRHHERIFEIFRRLHPYHHVPGTGIGLALCRRIVERHGGRIWVESQPGEGSTFRFTLPVRDADG